MTIEEKLRRECNRLGVSEVCVPLSNADEVFALYEAINKETELNEVFNHRKIKGYYYDSNWGFRYSKEDYHKRAGIPTVPLKKLITMRTNIIAENYTI